MVIFQSPTSWWTLGGVCSGKHWYAKIIMHTYIKLSYIYIICIYTVYTVDGQTAPATHDSVDSLDMEKSFVNWNPCFVVQHIHTLNLLLFFGRALSSRFFFFQISAFERSLEFWGCCQQDTPQDAMRNPHRIWCPRVFMKVYFLKFGIPTRERNVIIFARWLASGGQHLQSLGGAYLSWSFKDLREPQHIPGSLPSKNKHRMKIVATLFFSQERCSCNSLWRHIKDAVDNFVRDHWLVNTLRLVPWDFFVQKSRFVCFFWVPPQKRKCHVFLWDFQWLVQMYFLLILVPFFEDTR